MNKTELFQFLSDTTVSLEVQQLIVVTSGTRALTNKKDFIVNEISPCTHEEADTRLLLHTANAVRHDKDQAARKLSSLCRKLFTRLTRILCSRIDMPLT